MDLVNRVDFIFLVAVEEENEVEANDTMLSNNFDKLNELESHLIRHRELFLSRQIETYKIDMVRYVWLWEEFSCVWVWFIVLLYTQGKVFSVFAERTRRHPQLLGQGGHFLLHYGL